MTIFQAKRWSQIYARDGLPVQSNIFNIRAVRPVNIRNQIQNAPNLPVYSGDPLDSLGDFVTVYGDFPNVCFGFESLFQDVPGQQKCPKNSQKVHITPP